MAEAPKTSRTTLTEMMVRECLSQIGKTFDGSGYAFTKLDVANKHLANLGESYLPQFKYLRYFDASHNALRSVDDLAELPYLLKVKLSQNKIDSLKVFGPKDQGGEEEAPADADGEEPIQPFKYLQDLDVAHNKISALTALQCPKLTRLTLDSNKIKTAENFAGHEKLRTLSVQSNQLPNFIGFKEMPELEELFVADNNIVGLGGLESLPKLKKIHLQRNKIQKLDEEMPELPELEVLDLEGNPINKLEELDKLKPFEKLTNLNVGETPLAEEVENIRMEVLIKFPNFTVVNGEEVTDEEREEAIETAKQRWQEAEDARKEQERLAAEAEQEGEGDDE